MSLAVKICGFTRPSDVEAAIEAGADALGLVFDRGPRRVDRSLARELLEVTRGASVERVAVVGDLDVDERARIAELGFDLMQAVASRALAEAPGPLPLLPVFFDAPDLLDRVEAWRQSGPDSGPACARSLVGTLNLDGAGGGGTGTRPDWQRGRRMAEVSPLVLSGGLTADNLAAALSVVAAHGVDVCSGVESSPGIKDPKKMSAFVREARRWGARSPEAA